MWERLSLACHVLLEYWRNFHISYFDLRGGGLYHSPIKYWLVGESEEVSKGIRWIHKLIVKSVWARMLLGWWELACIHVRFQVERFQSMSRRSTNILGASLEKQRKQKRYNNVYTLLCFKFSLWWTPPLPRPKMKWVRTSISSVKL